MISGSSTIDTSSSSSAVIANAIQVLHPSRYSQPHHNLNLDPPSIRNNHKRRFSPLLLEHGERELQDWGVVASSSSNKTSFPGDLSSSRSTRKRLGSSSSDSNFNNMGSTSARMMGKKGSSKRKKKTTTKGSPVEAPPSTTMKSVDGRLRLCSKSIVFEPDDMSRGIIRLPFNRMICEPQHEQQQHELYSSANFGTTKEVRNGGGTDGSAMAIHSNGNHELGWNGPNCNNLNINSGGEQQRTQKNQQLQQPQNKNVVLVKCKKFWVMKKNNIIGPYEMMEMLSEFRFTFLHSNPLNFLDLGKRIYQIVHKQSYQIPPSTPTNNNNNNNTTSSTQPKTPTISLESLLQPLYDKPFDPANYLNIREQPLTTNLRTYLLAPLLSQPGCTIVTDQCLYFQPFNGVYSSVATKALHYKLDQIVGTARRYKGLNDCALELFFEDGPSVLLAFESWREREDVMRLLPRTNIRHSCSSGGDDIASRVYCHTDREFIMEVSKAWMEGLIGNFDYLLALNSASGRSFRDLSRYPVFPWVLADYDISKPDWSCCNGGLNPNSSTFASTITVPGKGGGGDRNKDIAIAADVAASKMCRDLTKPIGALNDERLEAFRKRWKSMQDSDDPDFLYGTHYSAAGYCLYYLVRTMPEQMLCLQNGKYDAPDRLFRSIERCYSSILVNQADLKESIPQFYDPKTGVDLLLNSSGLQLGVTQSGKLVCDVELPKWAKSPKDFLKKNRMVLESDYCTKKLPHWIDLIFGKKSRGDEALKAMNLFHPTSYLSSEDLEKMETDDERTNAEFQAMEFGICPDMLFCAGHPQRLFKVDVGGNASGQQSVTDLDTLLTDCLVVPNVARTQLLEDSDDDEQQRQRQQHKQDKDSGNSGPWEMLDVPAMHNPNKTMSDEGDASILLDSAPSSSMILRQQAKSRDETHCGGTKKGNSAWLSRSVTMSEEDLESSSDLADTEFNTGHTLIQEQEDYHHQHQPRQHEDVIVPTSLEDKVGMEVVKEMTPLPRRGVGNTSCSGNRSLLPYRPCGGTFGSQLDIDKNNNENSDNNQDSYSTSLTTVTPLSDANDPQGWEFKLSTCKGMHGNAVSGCYLSLEEEGGATTTNSCITTISLDGGLMVHYLPNSQSEQWKRRSFSSAAAPSSSLGRFYNIGKSNNTESTSDSNAQHINAPQFHSFRYHESSDPLACLTLVGDNTGGLIAFAGGEVGVVLAYGINSACALASVNSHRDAVTGISLVPRPSSVDGEVGSSRRKSRCTHIMTTCSFDATVKLWSVTITEGETVSIDREPLVELFDADSPVVCVAVVDIAGFGLVIAAGCSDGSFIVWVWTGSSTLWEIIHKEDVKRGYGSCADLKWATDTSCGETFLYAGFDAGFGNGKVASYVLRNGGIYSISKLQIGSPIQCLSVVDEDIFAGCADGGLRLVPVGEGGHFDYNPKVWAAINGTSAPGLSSLSVVVIKTSTLTERIYICAAGAEDGTVALFQIKELR